MHNFKKVLLSVVIVLFFLGIVSSIILVPFLNSEFYGSQEHKLLDSLEGQIDFVFVGASNTMSSVDPILLDKATGSFSYRICGRLMTLKSRTFLLERELQRNPIKTVVIDVSDSTLTRDEKHEFALGHEDAIWKLGSGFERIRYLFECATFEDLLDLYAREMVQSIEYWLSRIRGYELCNVNYNTKGYSGSSSVDITLSKENVIKTYSVKGVNMNYRQENIEELTELIKLCKDHNVRIILTVIPVSDSKVWSINNYDLFYDWMQDFCDDQNIEFYDMNLIRNRYNLFNDSISYWDENHMSEKGAYAFTEVFCDIIKKAETEDVSDYFYDSYEEMKADSPYMEYLK